MSKELSGSDVYKMNLEYPWNGSIQIPKKDQTTYNIKNDDKKYVLHATGYADATNGRTYVALSANTKITDDVRNKYNLM